MTQVDRKRFPTELRDCFVGNLQVMHSSAGYYLGRTCLDKEGDYEDAYSRETDYMTKVEAEAALVSGEYEVRDCPENDLAYSKGLPHPQGQTAESFAPKVAEERERFAQLAKSAGLD